jgi:hypothetical protein
VAKGENLEHGAFGIIEDEYNLANKTVKEIVGIIHNRTEERF